MQDFSGGQKITIQVKFLQSNLLIIGSGKWPNKINSIISSQNSKTLIENVGAREFLKLKIEQIEQLLKDKIVWIASTPENQLFILDKIKSFNNKVVLEKPVAVTSNQLNQLDHLNKNGNNKFYVSEPWRHSEIWRKAKSRLLTATGQKRLKIYRGGPIKRDYVDPPWDWMQHDLGLLGELLFVQKESLKIHCELSTNRDKLMVHIQALEGYEIEINLGLFPQRKELWVLNDQVFIDFANQDNFRDHPVNNIFEYICSEDFSSHFENQVWLTKQILNKLEEATPRRSI